MTGKTIYHGKLNQSKTTINLTKNRKGIYFILFEDAGKTVTSKMVIN